MAPDTFIRGGDVKAHPHYYCDLAGLAVLFAGFELLSLTQAEQRHPGGLRGAPRRKRAGVTVREHGPLYAWASYGGPISP